MRRTLAWAAAAAAIAFAPAPAPAQMGHGPMAAPKTALPEGAVIRTATVSGHTLTYRLYGWEDRNKMMAGMQGMPGMDTTGAATHHLMVFVAGPDGKEVAGAKVGFHVIGPDNAERKTLTMGMFGGYGADVALGAPGEHSVRAKVVAGRTVLEDRFAYAAP